MKDNKSKKLGVVNPSKDITRIPHIRASKGELLSRTDNSITSFSDKILEDISWAVDSYLSTAIYIYEHMHPNIFFKEPFNDYFCEYIKIATEEIKKMNVTNRNNKTNRLNNIKQYVEEYISTTLVSLKSDFNFIFDSHTKESANIINKINPKIKPLLNKEIINTFNGSIQKIEERIEKGVTEEILKIKDDTKQYSGKEIIWIEFVCKAYYENFVSILNDGKNIDEALAYLDEKIIIKHNRSKVAPARDKIIMLLYIAILPRFLRDYPEAYTKDSIFLPKNKGYRYKWEFGYISDELPQIIQFAYAKLILNSIKEYGIPYDYRLVIIPLKTIEKRIHSFMEKFYYKYPRNR